MSWLWKAGDPGSYGVEPHIRNMDDLDPWNTESSEPLGRGFPTLDIEVRASPGAVPDSFDVGPLRIVSGRIKDVIERAGGGAEFFPVSIRGPGIAPSIGSYYYLHPLDELACMDQERSVFTLDDGYIDRVSRFVIDESIAKRKPLFRLARCYALPLFVSDALADSLRALNASGVRLLPPESFKH